MNPPVKEIDIGVLSSEIVEFGDRIIELRNQIGGTVLEAIMEYCFRNNINVDEVIDLIPAGLKSIIAQEENIDGYTNSNSLDLM